MLLHIEHETKFTYTEPVHETIMEVRMSPVSTADQTVLGYRLRATPAAVVTSYRDGSGNRVELFNILTAVREALALGRGVCQDFTHLFLTAARAWQIPTRYVSGYVNQPGEIATHAWVQVWGGAGVGWVDVDPTRGTWVADDYVVTAVG